MNNKERNIKEILKDLEELLSRINNGSKYQDILDKYKYVCLPMENNI